MSSKDEVTKLSEDLMQLTHSQRGWVAAVIEQFKLPYEFVRNESSDLITPAVLDGVGDALRIHHAFSRQALSKDRFEHAFERALSMNGFDASLATSRTNRGHDLTIDGVRVSLKTEAAANIREARLHISKFMELGRGEWELPLLMGHFLEHMKGYERILQFRCHPAAEGHHFYELVEIPKLLLLEAQGAPLRVMENSRQTPKPGYASVYDADGQMKFELYFDGGTERKLQIKGIRKELCMLHATWRFGSTPL